MFKTNSQLKDELTTAQSKIASLEADFTAQSAELETAQSELASVREELTTAQSRVVELEASEAAQTERITELETSLTEQEAATAAAAASAGKLAVAEIAAAGHPAVEVNEEAPALSIREQYAKLPPGPARKAFRDKHAAELEAV